MRKSGYLRNSYYLCCFYSFHIIMVYNIYVLLVTIILIVVSMLIPNINVLSASSWCFCLCFSVHLFTELSLLVLSLRMLKFYNFEIFFYSFEIFGLWFGFI